jgi:glycosyltransferase involved in cell wall biosynthesis
MPRRLEVLIACSGLGRERRGFETFADECFRALRDDPRLHLVLAKGGGKRAPEEVRIPNVPRRTRTAAAAAQLLGRPRSFLEHVTFAAALVPYLAVRRPDLVFVSEWTIASALWRWREATRSRFRILLSNGAPYGPPFSRSDHVQQLTEAHRASALAAGEPPEKHSLVPYGFFLRRRPPARLEPALRTELGLPVDRPVVLSVGALNTFHKRHDHVVRAVAAARTRPFLVLLGQRDHETAVLERLAASLLAPRSYLIRTVRPDVVERYYAAADVFVLASRSEGFGRVYVEACAAGLPCVVADIAVAREVLGDLGLYDPMEGPAQLAALLDRELERAPGDAAAIDARRREMVARFDWDSLRERYVELFVRAASPAA